MKRIYFQSCLSFPNGFNQKGQDIASEINKDPLWSSPPSQYIFPIRFLVQNWYKTSLELPFNPIHISYSILIQFLFKTNATLSGASFRPNAYSLHNAYSKMMQILSGASFHPNTYSLFIIQFLSKTTLEPVTLHIPYSILF